MIWSRTSPRAEIAATSQCDLLISAIDCKGGTESRNRAQRGVFSSHGEPLLVQQVAVRAPDFQSPVTVVHVPLLLRLASVSWISVTIALAMCVPLGRRGVLHTPWR